MRNIPRKIGENWLKMSKNGRKHLKCSSGPHNFTRVFVNAQRAFIRHYMVFCAAWKCLEGIPNEIAGGSERESLECKAVHFHVLFTF